MKTVLCCVVFAVLSFVSCAQEKKDLTISFCAGKWNSPYYAQSKARNFYALDFDYHMASRHILSANFTAGKHDYFDDVLTNVTSSPDKRTNAEARYQTFSVLYKYRLLKTEALFINLGTGIGIMTHTREFQYREANGSQGPRQTMWTDLVFPVRMDLGFPLSERFQLGLIGGFFIHPDYPVLGYHAGPRISYIIK